MAVKKVANTMIRLIGDGAEKLLKNFENFRERELHKVTRAFHRFHIFFGGRLKGALSNFKAPQKLPNKRASRRNPIIFASFRII